MSRPPVHCTSIWRGHYTCQTIDARKSKSTITVNNQCPVFKHLSDAITVARYHSLIVDETTLPSCLEITARDDTNQIMAIAHTSHPTYGVQFHPESILTKDGMQIIENFLYYVAKVKITPLHTEKINSSPAQRNALKPYIFKIIEGTDLSEEEAYDAMDCIMNGGNRCANRLLYHRITYERRNYFRINRFCKSHASKAATIENGTDAIDIVGTGGDMANTFNISTTTSFVVAGAGVKVAKHGNRSVSSKSGSADVLEQLGVNISLTPEQAATCLDQCGICFLFAKKFHGSMKFAAPSVEKWVYVQCLTFLVLWPILRFTNYIVLGVYDEALMEPMAKVLMNLGIKGAMIVHGNDGLDEVTISSHTTVCEIQENKLIKYEITPEDYHIPIVDLSEVIGGTAEENAKITLAVLNGKQGPQRDIVVMNAACALYTAGKASSLAEGVRLAQESIDSGKALEKLEELKQVTAQYL